jgi:predicted  nucleic acid-binding Zn-ribbon protein
MTTDSPSERVLHRFMDRVETLCNEIESLQSEQAQWQNKVESYILRIEELEEENESLNDRLQSLKLDFSEFAGRMENRLKRIKQEAQALRNTEAKQE